MTGKHATIEGRIVSTVRIKSTVIYVYFNSGANFIPRTDASPGTPKNVRRTGVPVLRGRQTVPKDG